VLLTQEVQRVLFTTLPIYSVMSYSKCALNSLTRNILNTQVPLHSHERVQSHYTVGVDESSSSTIYGRRCLDMERMHIKALQQLPAWLSLGG
jgi:hypothetical protein